MRFLLGDAGDLDEDVAEMLRKEPRTVTTTCRIDFARVLVFIGGLARSPISYSGRRNAAAARIW